MSEQQRILLAVVFCTIIFIVWSSVFAPKPEPRPQAPATTEQPAPTAPSTPAPSAEQPAPAPGESKVEQAPATVPEETRKFATSLLRGELSNVEASLTQLDLPAFDERKNKEEPEGEARPVSLVTAERNGRKRQATVDFDLAGAKAPHLTFAPSTDGFALGGSHQGVTTRVSVKPRQDAYALDYVLSAENRSAGPLPIGATVTLTLQPVLKEEGSWFAPPADTMNGLCAVAGKVVREEANKLAEDGPWNAPEPASWGGIDRQYFVVAVLPKDAAAVGQCKMSAKDDVLTVEYTFTPQSTAANGSWERAFTLYVGPKRSQSLTGVSPELASVINYTIWGIPLGFLARPMVFVLSVFHGWTKSWGVAIMLLTLIVKLLLFPLTYKSSLSMRKMQLLRPDIEKIKKQFENDRERQQVEQMRLFKEKGVSPFGGCLPMLLQMPIWLALYRTLWSAVDLYQQSFLWIPDLTAKESFPFMALALGALTFLQQKIMPTSADSQQAKMMMYMMPVMMTVFMIALPSGLVLYIVVNSILTIFQQLVINRRPITL